MRFACAVLAFLLSGAATPAAGDAALWAELMQDGRVALVRHADTGGGAGDPPGFRLDDARPSAISPMRAAPTPARSASGSAPAALRSPRS